MQDVLSTLGDANWRLSDVVSAETLPGPERLSSAHSAYKKPAEALGEWSRWLTMIERSIVSLT